ncbi:NACHT domain-containing protein [Metabacillus halosaccharovorans]|uniref:NACHT domain-containing protein n=1 Tax=Metabacillus halosaccharovorans TaxID=930124 RepID=UPI00203A3C0E|nr:NACHT domain-containing protein [Metabacillus halosaccharovorans]MCM3443096.1 NACHT domain-containing protein [Metabacillus halosaccharovorans]
MPKKKVEQQIGLHSIRQIGNDAAIIFIHGLRGHPYKTWTKKDCKPLPFLLEQDTSFKHFDLFTFGYKTGFLLKRNHFRDVAKLLHTELKARTSYKELYFIVHSMGGLVVQSLLINQVERGNIDFTNSVKGIVYLAVPFFGASGGSVAAFTYTFLPPLIGERALSTQVRSLKVFGRDLEEQSEKWVHYSKSQISHIRQKNIYGQSDLTVHRFSAKPPYIEDADPVEEDHRSICKMDMESTAYHLISHFFQKKNPELTIGVNELNEQLETYQKWLIQKTKNFIVPGVNIPLSIENAWASLQVWEKPSDSPNETLKAKLAKYHEWEKLSQNWDIKRDAQDMTTLGNRVVLIGGPGSGKSTLAKRTVHQLSSQRQKVIFVKLSGVSKEMAFGKSFEEALWSNAVQGYPGNISNLKSNILQDLDIIVADGLDECGSFVREVSEALRDWAEGRPQMRVIITTRPIGYEPAFFYDYYHVEILPLDNKEIDDYAKKLITALKGVEQEERYFKRFRKELDRNKTATVASRSPLLLNFLIQLSVFGKSFGTYRAELYSKILEQWMSKSSRGESLDLNQPVALRSLEWIGWTIHHRFNHNGSGSSERELVSGLALFLTTEMNVKPLEAKELATVCLKYWTEKGVIEHLKVGFENTYTFIHLTLGEYTAARYLSSLSEEQQTEILFRYYRNPAWREIFLLAGGEGSASLIIEQLLQTNPEKHDVFNDMVLAAAVSLETDPNPDINKRLINRLSKTISSPFPILAYEAVEVYGGLAEQAPELTLAFTAPLLKHPQYWTRLVATKLSLKANMNVFKPDEYMEWLTNTPKEGAKIFHGEIPSGWVLWNETVVLGLKQLLNQGLTDEETTRIAEALSGANLNMRSVEDIKMLVSEYEITNLFVPFAQKFKFSLEKFDYLAMRKRSLAGELAFVQIILDTIPKKQIMAPLKKNIPYIQLAILIEGMKVGEQIAGDLNILSISDRHEEIQAVISGMITVLNIDVDALYDELHHVLNQLDHSDMFSIFYKLPDVPSAQPDWEKAKTVDLNLHHLVSALGHPSNTIALNAAKILYTGVGGANIKPIMLELLDSENEQFFHYGSKIIPEIFEEEATDVILKRLEDQPCTGFQYLYEIIINLPNSPLDERVLKALIMGIQNKDENVAKAAAEALAKVELAIDQDVVRNVLFYWDKNGVPCRSCQLNVKGSSCPKCRIVPPSPLPELLEVTKKNDLLQLEEWIEFCLHYRADVMEVSSKGLAKCLSSDPLRLADLIRDIREGKQANRLLDAVFHIDHHTLMQMKQEVISLLESKIPDVRKRLIKEIAVAKWLPQAEAVQLNERALEDEHPGVRNQAVVTARSIARL